MDSLIYWATLGLQDEAREIIEKRNAGSDACERMKTWAIDRLRLAATPPETDIDAVAAVHSLLQLADAMASTREDETGFNLLADALEAGLHNLKDHLEGMAGVTAEELALYPQYSPPNGIH